MGSGFFSQDNPPPVEQAPAGPSPGNVVVEEPTGVDGATASFFGRGAAPALQAFEQDAKGAADAAAASAAEAAASAVAAAASAGEALNVATGIDAYVDQAEAAKDAAQASATTAAGSATAAAGSASAANTSATQAAASATNAGNSATSAATSATNSAASAASAASSASQAASSAGSIDAAAATATAKAAEATTSATNAASSATSASNSALTATTKASEAAASASAASGSATSASNSASSAGTSAATATTKASEAATSANNAATSASTATTKASEASASATSASNSATSASGSAATATTKAAEASTSATNAAASASTATTKASEASTSATNAAGSATAAAGSATTAANSASAAGTSATNAATSATNAASSATAAAGSATTASSAQAAAESARDATLAAFDSFDDRYLGTKTSNPTADNDGNALVAGALYFNSTAGEMRVWTGSIWTAAYVSGAGVLLIANNLSDVANAATARANLALGNVENKSSATIRGEITSANVTTALGYTPYNSSNPAGYISGITSGMVTTALGYTPYNSSNPAGYISGITSGMVTTALGYTPANKAGDTFSGPIYVNNGSHQVTLASDGNVEVARSGGGAYIDLKDSTAEDYDVRLQASGTALAITASGGLTLNGSGVLTGITSANVTTALGYTPYNSSNPAGYITSSGTAAAVSATVTGTNGATLVYANMADNDQFRIVVGASASNQGYAEIATADDGTEPIYVRQYTGVFSSVLRTLTLLDGSGNTSIPGSLTIAGNTAVHSGNFNSYAPTLTGVGAFGTWGINVTGNAATVSSITSGQVTTALGYTPANKAGDTFTGTVTIPDLVVSDSLPVFSNGGFQYHQYQSPHVAFVKKTGGYNWYWRRNDTGLAGGANEVEDMSLTEGGSLTARTDIRAPQFLDSENTNYYLNPTGTSNLAGLTVANTITGSVSGNANTANFLNGGASSIDVDNITNRVNSGFWQSSTGTTAEGWPLDSGAWQHMISCTHSNTANYYAMQLGAAFDNQGLFYRSTSGGGNTPWSRVALYGNNYAGNLYASVYYDSNNTAYYVNPASGSTLAGQLNQYGYLNIAYGGSAYVGMGISNTSASASNFATSFIDFSNESQTQKASIFAHFGTDGHGYLQFLSTAPGVARNVDSRTTTAYAYYNQWSFQTAAGIATNIIYDRDNSAYYVDPASTSNLNDIRGSYIRSYGNVDVDSDLWVGTASGKTSSYIYMKDVDEGDRAIHCNSNRIGFLTQGGGWGSWCEDDGSWRNTSYIQTPIIYDINNTGYYVDPASSSFLNAVTFDGLVTGRASASTDVNSANDTGSFSVRGSTTTVAAMSFHRAGAYAMNMGLGTDNVFRIGGWSASSNAFQMSGSGDLTMLGNVTAYSDARIKKDVETISGALDLVSSMRGVRYTRIDNEKRGVGVIAQEMLEVVPEVVQQGVGDDDTLSVAYGNLVGVLIEAIKELKTEVDNLKATVH